MVFESSVIHKGTKTTQTLITPLGRFESSVIHKGTKTTSRNT